MKLRTKKKYTNDDKFKRYFGIKPNIFSKRFIQS